MTLAAVSDSELLHQRIGFWNDVHGFTMPSMTRGLVDETYTEYLDKSTVVSDVADIFVRFEHVLGQLCFCFRSC